MWSDPDPASTGVLGRKGKEKKRKEKKRKEKKRKERKRTGKERKGKEKKKGKGKKLLPNLTYGDNHGHITL